NQLQAIVQNVFSIPHLLRNKPVAFVLQEGGKVSHPRELTAVGDQYVQSHAGPPSFSHRPGVDRCLAATHSAA
ncbi:hypothetical protein, partial [Pantoea ananatis]|uniref:hypothetical protein n=2 Tax=Pantoea ananas TaxID=553 RepID=UPI001B315FC9